MTVRIDLPQQIEQTLRDRVTDLDRALKESALIELFRQQKLSHVELSEGLGLDRHQTDALLQQHGVTEGSLTWGDLAADEATLERVLGSVGEQRR